MGFTAEEIAGVDAIATLESRRASYPTTGDYPFLIGPAEELTRLQELPEFNKQSFEAILQDAAEVDLAKWIAQRGRELEEDGFEIDEVLGDRPGEVKEKREIATHRDVVSTKIFPRVFIGSAKIREPWHLPAVLKYGAWNDCPEPEVQCAFHRKWQAEYGSLIVGVSSDVIECVVSKPPRDQDAAMRLAWEQYWYCADIVDQGYESIANLAATLLNSTYWYFWWD